MFLGSTHRIGVWHIKSEFGLARQISWTLQIASTSTLWPLKDRTAYHVMGDKLKISSFNRVIVKLHSIRPNSSRRSLAPLYQTVMLGDITLRQPVRQPNRIGVWHIEKFDLIFQTNIEVDLHKYTEVDVLREHSNWSLTYRSLVWLDK